MGRRFCLLMLVGSCVPPSASLIQRSSYNYLAMIMNDTKVFFLLQPDDRKALSLGAAVFRRVGSGVGRTICLARHLAWAAFSRPR